MTGNRPQLLAQRAGQQQITFSQLTAMQQPCQSVSGLEKTLPRSESESVRERNMCKGVVTMWGGGGAEPHQFIGTQGFATVAFKEQPCRFKTLFITLYNAFNAEVKLQIYTKSTSAFLWIHFNQIAAPFYVR